MKTKFNSDDDLPLNKPLKLYLETIVIRSIPATICWSWRRLQDMSWRHFQHVFSVTILRLPRRFEDVLKTSWRRLAKTSWRHLEDVFKTSRKSSSRRLQDVLEDEKLLRWRRLEDISWRRFQDVSVANKIFTGDICI